MYASDADAAIVAQAAISRRRWPTEAAPLFLRRSGKRGRHDRRCMLRARFEACFRGGDVCASRRSPFPQEDADVVTGRAGAPEQEDRRHDLRALAEAGINPDDASRAGSRAAAPAGLFLLTGDVGSPGSPRVRARLPHSARVDGHHVVFLLCALQRRVFLAEQALDRPALAPAISCSKDADPVDRREEQHAQAEHHDERMLFSYRCSSSTRRWHRWRRHMPQSKRPRHPRC